MTARDPRNFDWAQLAQDCQAFVDVYADTTDLASDTVLGSFLGRILRTAGATIPDTTERD